ncbi:MAG: DUF4342 domain-containing protein [Bacteroidales bacterium]|jgi:hypothetical protein
MEESKKSYQETFRVSGDEILARIKEVIKAGNASRVIIKNEKDETIMEFPVTVGAIGVVLIPLYAALGALAALAMKYTIIVEKKTEPEKKDN